GFGWVQWGLALRELKKVADSTSQSVSPAPAQVVPPPPAQVVPPPPTEVAPPPIQVIVPRAIITEQVLPWIGTLPPALRLLLAFGVLVAFWWCMLMVLWSVAPQKLVELHERLPDPKTLDQAAEATDKLTSGLSKALR